MNNFRVIDNLPVATKFVLETGQVRTMMAKNFNVILVSQIILFSEQF